MRRKRRFHIEENNRDRWLISYADFITLLFAFFVVLFAAAVSKNPEISRVSQAIHSGFRVMAVLPSHGDHSSTSSDSPSGGAIQLSTGSTAKSISGTAASAVDIEALRRQLQTAIGAEIKNGEVDMRVTPEGFVVSLRDVGFFNSGEAVLAPGAAEKIERIADVLVHQGLNIRVEGHSDDQPIHTAEFHSNWELSTARAMTVLKLLIDQAGLNPAKVSVAGYAEFRPVADNATAEGRKMNRRVDLVVVAETSVPSAQAAKAHANDSQTVPQTPSILQSSAQHGTPVHSNATDLK